METLPAEEPARRARPVAAAVCLAAGVASMFLPFGLSAPAAATLAVLVAVGGMWLTEAMSIGAAALLVPVLGIVLGAADAKSAFSGFGDPIVFLFFGTFLLTDAANRHGLDRRLADAVMGSAWVRASPRRLLFAVAILGFVISAWVNNTATTAMLLPLALTAERFGSRTFLVSVLLATSWAPSLGGLATPVGTAPNLIGLAQLDPSVRPSFAAWMAAFAPLAAIATLGSTAWLAWRGGSVAAAPESAPAVIAAPAARRPWTRAERTIVAVAAVAIVLWIAPGLLGALPGMKDAAWLKTWRERFPEAAVPLTGGVLLFLLPSGAPDASRIADASSFRRLDWSTILLFGGGISLGTMLEKSGLARTMGEAIFDAMPVQGEFGITLAATLVAVLVSELTSNTASAALVVPIVVALAKAAGMSPVGPALAATIGCSFGFMLPVSTPPNALVYGTGRIRLAEMVRAGILLDVAGAVLVAAWITLLF